jgi:hypothetical protein
VTHEYVIALHGRVEPAGPGAADVPCTAIAWAADRVLAVGPDEVVRAISRGDSTFLDLRGCLVTALPADPARADALVREADAAEAARGPAPLLIAVGLLDPDTCLEPGSPADLAFWDASAEPGVTVPPGATASEASVQRGLRLVAMVRGGAFTEGDEHRGPFPTASAVHPSRPASSTSGAVPGSTGRTAPSNVERASRSGT